jgi:hypothetical protein
MKNAVRYFLFPLLACSFHLATPLEAQENRAQAVLDELATHGWVSERFVLLRGQSRSVAARDVKRIEQVWGLTLS